MDLNRNLQIQAGVVRRLSKELIMYREEQEKEMQKVQALKDRNADSHDIKYAENILAESSAMIPDTLQRLKAAIKNLIEFLEENNTDLAGGEDYESAKNELVKAQGLLTQ